MNLGTCLKSLHGGVSQNWGGTFLGGPYNTIIISRGLNRKLPLERLFVGDPLLNFPLSARKPGIEALIGKFSGSP